MVRIWTRVGFELVMFTSTLVALVQHARKTAHTKNAQMWSYGTESESMHI